MFERGRNFLGRLAAAKFPERSVLDFMLDDLFNIESQSHPSAFPALRGIARREEPHLDLNRKAPDIIRNSFKINF